MMLHSGCKVEGLTRFVMGEAEGSASDADADTRQQWHGNRRDTWAPGIISESSPKAQCLAEHGTGRAQLYPLHHSWEGRSPKCLASPIQILFLRFMISRRHDA